MSNQRKRRFDLLGEILAAMRVLRLRMLNSMEPLGILLRKSDCPLFRDLGNGLWEGGGLAESWQKKRADDTRRGEALSVLEDGELRALDSFFQNLGKSGREEQSQLFAATIAELEEYQIQAKSRYMNTGRLYTALGTLIGIAICVLIV